MSPASSAAPDVQGRFQQGLVDLKRRAGLYVEDPGAVSIADGVLYRARVTIPARVPVGRFTAETFLIRDGRVLAAAIRAIDIRKSGFERSVARAAIRRSWLYGLPAVALSPLPGWAAGWVARRLCLPPERVPDVPSALDELARPRTAATLTWRCSSRW